MTMWQDSLNLMKAEKANGLRWQLLRCGRLCHQSI
jgi:hypothetical protein